MPTAAKDEDFSSQKQSLNIFQQQELELSDSSRGKNQSRPKTQQSYVMSRAKTSLEQPENCKTLPVLKPYEETSTQLSNAQIQNKYQGFKDSFAVCSEYNLLSRGSSHANLGPLPVSTSMVDRAKDISRAYNKKKLRALNKGKILLC